MYSLYSAFKKVPIAKKITDIAERHFTDDEEHVMWLNRESFSEPILREATQKGL